MTKFSNVVELPMRSTYQQGQLAGLEAALQISLELNYGRAGRRALDGVARVIKLEIKKLQNNAT